MLHRIRKAMDERDKGFTMVEILVVVILIGILAAVSIPKFLNQKHKAIDSSLQSDVTNAAIQVQTWITDHPQSEVPTEKQARGHDDNTTVYTGAAAVAALQDVVPSNGNTIQVKSLYTAADANLGAFQICAYNTDASSAKDSTHAYIYDSENGGLQAKTGACK